MQVFPKRFLIRRQHRIGHLGPDRVADGLLQLAGEWRCTRLELEAHVDRQKGVAQRSRSSGNRPARSSDVLPRPDRPYRTVTGASSTCPSSDMLHGRARRRTHARFPRTTPAPATGSRRRVAWSSLRWSRRARAPHGTDFVGQHRRAAPASGSPAGARPKSKCLKVIWHLPIATRVTLVIVVDNHGHDEAPTQNASAIDLPPHSTP